MGSVEDLGRSGPPRLHLRVAGDAEGRWASAGLAGVERVEAGVNGTVALTHSPGADAQAILDSARHTGPVEHFSSPIGACPKCSGSC